MKTILLFALLAVTGATDARPAQTATNPASQELRVSLKYNTEATRFEVYAEANFTDEHFLLGASQISVVVPKSVADGSLNVVSATAHWPIIPTCMPRQPRPAMIFTALIRWVSRLRYNPTRPSCCLPSV